MNTRKRIFLGVLALILLLSLIGCGAKVKTPKPTATPKTTPIVTPTSTPVVKEKAVQPTATPVPSTFSIHFIDVGQADAALVECDGHYMLIDGGNKGDSDLIYSVLKSAEVPKLDIVVGTHAHEDHIGGLPGALNYTTADLVLCPTDDYDSDAFEDFKKYAGEIVIPEVGDTYELGSSEVTILGLNGGSGRNNTSIILRIDYGETSFLFVGDAEREAEEEVLDADEESLAATVLKVGHHGSDSSTSYRFLRAVMPQYAVISVGEDNSHGHPTDEVLSRLRDAEVTVYRTDLNGDIFCTSNGKTVTFRVERKVNDIEVIEEIVRKSCESYNAKKDRVLPGTLTYDIESPTEVELEYEIDELIYADTEYLVDKSIQEVLNYVIADLNKVTLAESVTVSVEADYDHTSKNSKPEPEPEPVGTNYIGNRNTKKFHYSWCSSVKQMKESNKYYYTGTRDGMLNKGYVPCKKCTP